MAKIKAKRKGAGRKKGQPVKAYDKRMTATAIMQKSFEGDHRQDVRDFYTQVRGMLISTTSPALEDFPFNTKNIVKQVLKSVLNNDYNFFKKFAEYMRVVSDPQPFSHFSQPADREMFVLSLLANEHNSKSEKQVPMTIDLIGDYLQNHLGYRPSKSSIHKKAHVVGLPLNKRFGKAH